MGPGAEKCYHDFVEFVSKERYDFVENICSSDVEYQNKDEFVVNALWFDTTGGWIQFVDTLELPYVRVLLEDRIYLVYKFIRQRYFKGWDQMDLVVMIDVPEDEMWENIHYLAAYKGVVLSHQWRDASSFSFKDRSEFFQYCRDTAQSWHETVLRAYDTGFLVAEVGTKLPIAKILVDRWSRLRFDDLEEP